MNILKLTLAVFLQLILMSSSCKRDSGYYDFRLKLLNKSDNAVYTCFYQSYPDTVLGSHNPFSSDSRVEPNETFTLGRGGSWESAFKEDISQKLMIYVFDADVVENTPWDTIKANYLVLKRYDLTLQDIEEMDWTICYP